MKEGKSSGSAVSTTLFRALESIRPAKERVLFDPYAIRFLSGKPKFILNTRFLISGRLLNKIINGLLARVIPGGTNYVIVRARYIDDYLNQCIEDGIEQLVLLGAGYDSRAFRFAALAQRVKVFEIDHPDSQRNKKEIVRKIFGCLPDHVIYVPVDFEKTKLGVSLFAHGYDKKKKTLFIWEGVTVYISREAVEETLAFVANNSGEGSSIIFDYIYKSAIDGGIKEAENMKTQAAEASESFKFGIKEGAAEEFLTKRGFDNVKNMNAKSLEERYFKGTNRKSCPFYDIVHATVSPREGDRV